MAADDPVARHLVIRGRVQGVGFRDALCAFATAARVAGWVRNTADGHVEAVVQGPQHAVDRVIAWSNRGPPLARVEAVDVDIVAVEPARRTFERR